MADLGYPLAGSPMDGPGRLWRFQSRTGDGCVNPLVDARCGLGSGSFRLRPFSRIAEGIGVWGFYLSERVSHNDRTVQTQPRLR